MEYKKTSCGTSHLCYPTTFPENPTLRTAICAVSCDSPEGANDVALIVFNRGFSGRGAGKAVGVASNSEENVTL